MKTPISVCRNLLETCLNKIEADPKVLPKNRQELYKKVSELYNVNTAGRHITPSVVYLRIKSWSLNPKTPLGKKGRFGPSSNLAKRKSRAEKFGGTPEIKKAHKILKEYFKERPRLVQKVIEGSLVAAVKLNCLECVGHQQAEITKCKLYHCPFWAFRPGFKTNSEEEGEVSK